MLRLFPPPTMPAFADDFADGALDARYVPIGDDGAVSEAPGALTLAVDAGAVGPQRTQGVAVPVFAGNLSIEIEIAAMNFAAYTAGYQWPVIIAWNSAGNYDAIGPRRGASGDTLAYQRERGGVVDHYEEFALPALPLRLRLVKSAATVKVYVRGDGDDESLLATSTDFPGAAFGIAALHTTEAEAASVDIARLAVIPEFAIERINHLVFGVHLAGVVVIEGRGFGAGMSATIGGAAAAVTVESASRARIVGPVFAGSATRTLRVYFGDDDAGGLAVPLRYSDAGYLMLRAEEPQGRYTAAHDNPRNVWLALKGQELDRLHHAATDFIALEIHPGKTQQCIEEHERFYGVRPSDLEGIDARRARCLMRRVARPRINVPTLSAIVAAVLPGRGIVENAGFDDYGDLIWQIQAYEDTVNELSTTSHAELEQFLDACAPGYVIARVGHNGFILGASRLGRDFLDSVSE